MTKLAVLVTSVALCASGAILGCSGSSGDGGGDAGAADGSTPADGGSSDGAASDAGGHDAALHCMPNTVSGAAAAGSYIAQETASCACDSSQPFPDAGLGAAGAPCTSYRNCAVTCCACADPAKKFTAAICKPDGTCADDATACAGVLADSFASKGICR